MEQIRWYNIAVKYCNIKLTEMSITNIHVNFTSFDITMVTNM